MNQSLRAVFAAALLVTLTPCLGNDEPVPELELDIAHINDHHSQLEAFPAIELMLDGQATQVELGGFARQTTLFKSLDATPGLLKLHAGDALTGSLYFTFFKGAADAQLMNTICFDAFTPGNHEFDNGDALLADFLDELSKGNCKTPVISTNVWPAVGSPLAPPDKPPYITRHAIKIIHGVEVGLIGLTIVGKTVNSSRPLATTRFLDEVDSAQRAIDELKMRGVRHIVLLTHQGYDADRRMAAMLTDVDVIIGGDSHTLLGDFSAVGIRSSSGSYPTVVTNRDGDRVCIGQAWEYAKAFALMKVKFNRHGQVVDCAGQASLVIGDNFKRKDAGGIWQLLGATERESLIAALATTPAVRVVAPDSVASATLSAYTSRVATEKAKSIGTVGEALCLVRVPGESTNRSAGVAGCESANKLARGSDVAQVVAEAFLTASKRADFSLQNAGGARIAVPAGIFTMNTAFTLLPFSNVLVELDVTGAEVAATLEDSVSNHLDNAQSNGSHPYAAGLRWTLDMSRPKGQRFSNLQWRDRITGVWSDLDPVATYVLVTNDFIASGKDGYATLGPIYAAGRYVNTYLLYTQCLVDHVLTSDTLARPSAADYSHQRVTTAAGITLP